MHLTTVRESGRVNFILNQRVDDAYDVSVEDERAVVCLPSNRRDSQKVRSTMSSLSLPFCWPNFCSVSLHWKSEKPVAIGLSRMYQVDTDSDTFRDDERIVTADQRKWDVHCEDSLDGWR